MNKNGSVDLESGISPIRSGTLDFPASERGDGSQVVLFPESARETHGGSDRSVVAQVGGGDSFAVVRFDGL